MATSLRKFTILVSCTIFLQLLFLNVANSTYAFGLDNSRTPRKTLLATEGSGLLSTLQHLIDQCFQKKDIFWCFKIQGSRLLGRALKFTNIQIIDGISLVKRITKNDNNNPNAEQKYDDSNGKLETGRSQNDQLNLSNRDLENLSLKSLDSLLTERFITFVRSRQVQVNMPRLLAFGRKSSHDLWNNVLDPILKSWSADSKIVDLESESVESRKKKGGQNFLGPFVAAVLLKTAILKMAYHSIAIVAGKALVVGKIALIISAIIGLKKLVSSDSEKTTYEIVKHPQVSQSHTYSSSHAGDYEGGHEGVGGGGSGGGSGGGGGSYHRSMDDEMMMQDKAYNAWVPSHPSSMS